MNKWIPISIIAALVIAVAVITIVLSMKIGDTNDKLDAANAQIATLQGQVSSLQSNVSSLQSQLTAAQNQAKTLQTSLDAANGQIKTLSDTVASQTTTINNQAAQIKTMSYPRHFTSVPELADFLQKDDTDKMFGVIPPGQQPTDIQKAEMAFVLQVKAARAGYLITVNLPLAGGLDTITDRAVVGGNQIYMIRAWDDFIQPYGTVSPAIPSYPIVPPP